LIQYVEGDLFQFVASCPNKVLIPHVCNDVGAWGAGFVIPLGRTYPLAREEYLQMSTVDGYQLGHTGFVKVAPNVTVANMIAQGMGGQRPLRYNALSKCLDTVGDYADQYDMGIVAPMFGSGLAGGNWLFIEEMINDAWIDRGIKVTVCYLLSNMPSNWKPPRV
jgi:hypothetical protein